MKNYQSYCWLDISPGQCSIKAKNTIEAKRKAIKRFVDDYKKYLEKHITIYEK